MTPKPSNKARRAAGGGLLAALLASCTMTNVAVTAPDHQDPELVTPHFDLAPAELLEQVVRTLEELERVEVVQTDPAALRVEATYTTGLFRFVDDIAISVEAAPQGGSLLHMRGKSRVGKSDFGQNARTLKQIIATLRERIAGS